jgi:hypothetical protein
MNSYNYLYRITNTKLNRHYYGTRSSKVPPEKDLGVKYFSSSRDKSFKEDQKLSPDDYRYKIILVTSSRKRALRYECRIHKIFKVDMNPAFYNIARQTSTKFSTSGRRSVRDADGNTFSVSVDDPRIKTGELVSLNCRKIHALTSSGESISVFTDDPRIKTGELKVFSKGRIKAKDTKTGETFYVSLKDERLVSGEFVPFSKGRVSVRDKDGNTMSVSNTDIRFLSGELKHATKGRVTVKDKDGNMMSVYKDDPRYLSGELVSNMKGMMYARDRNGKTHLVSNKDPRVLSGELISARRGTKNKKKCEFHD